MKHTYANAFSELTTWPGTLGDMPYRAHSFDKFYTVMGQIPGACRFDQDVRPLGFFWLSKIRVVPLINQCL